MNQQKLPDGAEYTPAPQGIHGRDEVHVAEERATTRYEDPQARPEVTTPGQARMAKAKPWLGALGGCVVLLILGVVGLSLLVAIPLGIFGLREALFGALVFAL
ncbi:hypothetical protein [Corynebacterium cystitidis]|uniref:hypothetical protein n=1 Tax=Corynebacterium cystitidis TaxID=35757 RepID=UPI000B826C76|nr:hypothetical protein [Corynebacterium cystitidis]